LGDPVTFGCEIPTSAQVFWEGPNNFESNQEVFTINNTTVNELGIYTAYLIDVNGCVSQEVAYPLTVSENYSFDDFVLPNVITVNDDTVNETLDIDGFLKTCDDYTITYFNRWGNLIMSHGRGQTPFSGKTADGQNLADGVYFYKLVYFSGGQQKQVEKAGFVHVLK
jgi:gliding motility-associated-like protein